MAGPGWCRESAGKQELWCPEDGLGAGGWGWGTPAWGLHLGGAGDGRAGVWLICGGI